MYCDTVAIAGAAATVHPSLYEVPSSPPKVSADVIHLAKKQASFKPRGALELLIPMNLLT